LNTKEDIDFFKQYFSGQIDLVAGLPNKLHKKILFSCILDTLGQARYPKGSNKKRIVSFINTCSDWEDRNRVSLSQLLYNFDRKLSYSEKKQSELYGYAQKRISSLDRARVYRASEVDPFFNEFKKTVTKKESKSLKLAKYKYVDLFYAYRNMLVHNFKEPGHALESTSDGEFTLFHFGDSRYGQLIFPVGFFQYICTSCLDGLHSYLIDSNINPYKDGIYDFSDIWILKEKFFEPQSSKLMYRVARLSLHSAYQAVRVKIGQIYRQSRH